MYKYLVITNGYNKEDLNERFGQNSYITRLVNKVNNLQELKEYLQKNEYNRIILHNLRKVHLAMFLREFEEMGIVSGVDGWRLK